MSDSTHSSDQGPHHLAQTIRRALSVSTADLPEEWLLDFFFDVLYQASFRVENGHPLTGRVMWPNPESRMDTGNLGLLKLHHPVPLTVANLAALLPGTQPEVSALLVSGAEGQSPVIQGIVRCRGALCRTGLFSVEILGPAHLKVDPGLESPVELRRNRLHLTTQKVLERGPVRNRLSALLQGLFPSVQKLLPVDIASSPLLSAGAFPLPGGAVLMSEQDWPETLEQFWTQALISLLQRIYQMRRGSTMLVTRRIEELAHSDDGTAHGAGFSQLRHLLEQQAVQAILQQVEAVQALSERAESLSEIPPDDLTLHEPSLPNNRSGHGDEISPAIEFLASLARVDGFLRLDSHLDLITFGGQPGAANLPERIYLAGDETASESSLTPISFRSFGPRNQALLSQCHQNPDAVGFAFTQDGDVRAMLWHEEKLVVWNSVHLPLR